MDFELSEAQRALRDLAREIFTRELTPERLKAAGQGDDAELWRTLAEANLLGAALPEAHGGMGFGLLELGVLLQEAGRAVAPVPLRETLVLGALPIARFGTLAQQECWLPAVARGEVRLTGILESGARPIRAEVAAGGFRLHGVARAVPAAGDAARVLVPATGDVGTGCFLVDPKGRGVRCQGARTFAAGPLFELSLDGADVSEDALLGGELRGEGARAWLEDCALVSTCALQLGVSERALEITADYLREREQFGAPIGSFPAVQHRAADAWIDLECLRWTAWRAAWLLAEGRPARREAAVAKFWAAEAGAHIAATAQHLHGGIGVDLDYPLHRYFLSSKRLELAGGGSHAQLARIGADLASSAPQELA